MGRRADLILVNGNPVEDIENTTRIIGVMIRGNWLSRSRLDEMLADVATSYRRQAKGRL